MRNLVKEKSRKWIMLLFIMLGAGASAQSTDAGMKALDYENYATARRIFSQLISQRPDNADNYYYLGITYCNLGKIDSARAVFTAGTQADPKSLNNYVGLGRTYLEENNVQEAMKDFDKARSLTNQKDISQYKLIADAYASAAHPNFDMAISLLKKAEQYNNKDADLYWVFGKVYEAAGKSGDAVSSYERATELDPSYAKAYTRIGVIWRNARNGTLSNENFQKALAADPNFPPAYRELAELYFYTGQYDLAAQTYEKYRSLADDDDETKFRYAQFLFVTKKYQESLDMLNGLKDKIASPIMFRMLGYAEYETGNYAKGLSDINHFFKVMDSAKLISSDYEYLGKLQMKTDSVNEGVMNIERAVMKDTTRYGLYDTIAAFYYKDKMYAQAASFYMKKLSSMTKEASFSDLGNTYRMAGMSYYFAKDFIKSDSVFGELSKLSPSYPVSYLFRARCMLYIDSLDTARSRAYPYYNLFISKAWADSARYRRELAEAYQYLGNYNTFYRNYGAGLYYFGIASRFDPENSQVNETMKALKERVKNTGGSTIPAVKDSAGYEVNMIVNGSTLSVLYDPGASGLTVNDTGATQFALSGGTKADLVKLGDNSLKNVPIALIADQKYPVAVGTDVLNKMNIVFDYQTAMFLQR